MNGLRVLLITGALGVSAATAYLLIPSNIDPINKFSWSENLGWMNWRDADGTNEGVLVDNDFLTGYVWMENTGWLDVGDGNGPYVNSTGGDFGLNILGNDDLEGYAWGENIGWVNFGWAANSANAGRARFDGVANRFRGFAWGENAGWISLNDGVRFVGLQSNVVPSAPVPDAVNPDKVRFVSFSVPAGDGETALRVRLVSLHHVNPPYTGGASIPFTAFEGQSQYVGPPAQYVESVSSGTPFYASKLQCTPEYRDWSTITVLHVTGEGIVPSSIYDVENLAASCAGNEGTCLLVSGALSIKTTRWGDVVSLFNPPSTTTQPDTSDIASLVDKFKSMAGAPIKARAMLGGTDTRGNIDIIPDLNFAHIAACVDAFKGLAYPYKPGKCANAQSTACTTTTDCGANGPCILCP